MVLIEMRVIVGIITLHSPQNACCVSSKIALSFLQRPPRVHCRETRQLGCWLNVLNRNTELRMSPIPLHGSDLAMQLLPKVWE